MKIIILVVLSIIANIACYGIVRMWLKYSYQRNVMDIPNERSAHKRPTPTSGGIGIALSTLLMFVCSLFLIRGSSVSIFLLYAGLSTILAIISLYDDYSSLPISVRLTTQLVVSILIVLASGTIGQIYLPYVGTIALSVPMSAFVLIIWLTSFINMFNFMDGIDGIASTQAIIAVIGWMIILVPYAKWELLTLAVLILGSCSGFLILNWSPAKIFMGDIGSIWLGFTLAVYPILVYRQIDNPRTLIVGILFVFPFLFDATFTIIRRALHGENILRSHFTHLYQRLVTEGFSHSFITKLYGVLAIVSVINGIIYFYSPYDITLFVNLIVVVSIHLALMMYVYYLQGKSHYIKAS